MYTQHGESSLHSTLLFFSKEGITVTYEFTMQFVYVSCQLLNQFTEFYEMFHEVMKLLNMRFSAIRLLSPPLLAVFFFSNAFYLCSLLRMISRVSQLCKRICNTVYTHLQTGQGKRGVSNVRYQHSDYGLYSEFIIYKFTYFCLFLISDNENEHRRFLRA